MAIVHAFVSAISDGVDTTIVRPSNWNADHTIEAGTITEAMLTITPTADLATHVAAADPHTGYRLESADHSHASSGAQAGQIAHSALTGLGNDDHTQYRLESVDHTHQSTGAEAGKLDHGAALNGLTDDDHTQYSLLAGRAGGQTLIGGTAVGDGLTLRATSGIGAGAEFIALSVGNNGALEALRAGQANSQSVVALGTTVLDLTNSSTLEPRLIIAGAGVAHNVQVVRHTTVGGGGAILTLSANRGAGVNTHTSGALQAGDGAGTLSFTGSDGVRFIAAATITAAVRTTFTTDTAIVDLVFNANDGSSATSPPERLRLTGTGNVIIGAQAAVATGAVNGFLYIPTCAGDPTGVPTAVTGKVAMVFDTTNNELNIYDGGWLKAVFA